MLFNCSLGLESFLEKKAKTVIILGASSDIGTAVAEVSGDQGYNVVLHHHTNLLRVQRLSKKLRSQNTQTLIVNGRVDQTQDIKKLFTKTLAKFGSFDVLVNCAALPNKRAPIDEIGYDEIQEVISVTLTGQLLIISEAVKVMAKKYGGSGGAIINISSQAAETGGWMLTPYVAGKSGVEGMTKALAKELGSENIRINCVRPGLISTESSLQRGEKQKERVYEIPLGRLGLPSDVAEAVSWLMSDKSSYVTGATIPVTGGR